MNETMNEAKSDQYREKALRCLKLARALSDQKARRDFVMLAVGWFKMAKLAERDQPTAKTSSNGW